VICSAFSSKHDGADYYPPLPLWQQDGFYLTAVCCLVSELLRDLTALSNIRSGCFSFLLAQCAMHDSVDHNVGSVLDVEMDCD
jgi:hypothetical protein